MWVQNFKASAEAESCGGKTQILNAEHPDYFDCLNSEIKGAKCMNAF